VGIGGVEVPSLASVPGHDPWPWQRGGRVLSRFQGGEFVERKRRWRQGLEEAIPNQRARRGADDEDRRFLHVPW